ncbi:MAG TPA: SAM-dependent methyltransferase [Acidimicrobiales bacterium]|nr:SAM-dependent methyltransferase [Acidimicrobiales bacterium]
MSEPTSGAELRRAPFPEVNTEVAHVARVYDFLLGGETNFAVDRAAAEEVTASAGGVETSRRYVRANRRFLGRAVRYLVTEAGVRQFLDLGSGIPTEENVHEVAQAIAPESRIVYVDNDPIVLAHGHQLLKSSEEGATVFLHSDLRDHDDVLREAAATLDFSRPVAVMLVSMLHLFPDSARPYELLQPYLDAVPSGSYLVLSHLAGESDEMSKLGEAVEDNDTMNYTLTMRGRADVTRFFDGLDLVEPGVVFVDEWRPDPDDPTGTIPFHCGVARKP